MRASRRKRRTSFTAGPMATASSATTIGRRSGRWPLPPTKRGVTFQYEQLDPQAQYRVRLSLVRPRYARRYAGRQHQTGESIYADNLPLAENLEPPEYRADFFEFDIPKAATSDGKLTLWLKKQPGIGEGLKSDVTIWRNTGGWGTLVSEVWLMKKGAVFPSRSHAPACAKGKLTGRANRRSKTAGVKPAARRGAARPTFCLSR